MKKDRLRQQIDKRLDHIDDRFLPIIYSLLEDFSKRAYSISRNEETLLKARRADLKSGKIKGLTLDEVNFKLSQRKKAD